MTLINLCKYLFLIEIIISPFASTRAAAAEVTLAVASNFNGVIPSLINEFERRTGHTSRVSYGSSGRLYAQIVNGAPFDVFLSADIAKPQQLVLTDHTEQEVVIYAIGRLALWSGLPEVVFDDEQALLSPNIKKVALANPKLAPYGMAAEEALQNLGFLQLLKDKLVTGESIAQAFQFSHSGNAELGFVAYSQILSLPPETLTSHWLVPQELHGPINQGAVLLDRGSDNPAAHSFIEFLMGDEARAIISQFGYSVPNQEVGR